MSNKYYVYKMFLDRAFCLVGKRSEIESDSSLVSRTGSSMNYYLNHAVELDSIKDDLAELLDEEFNKREK